MLSSANAFNLDQSENTSCCSISIWHSTLIYLSPQFLLNVFPHYQTIVITIIIIFIIIIIIILPTVTIILLTATVTGDHSFMHGCSSS